MTQALVNILTVQRGKQSVLGRAYGIIGTDTNIILEQDVGDFESRRHGNNQLVSYGYVRLYSNITNQIIIAPSDYVT